jgi:hypothetical protein
MKRFTVIFTALFALTVLMCHKPVTLNSKRLLYIRLCIEELGTCDVYFFRQSEAADLQNYKQTVTLQDLPETFIAEKHRNRPNMKTITSDTINFFVPYDRR